jgi:hypothetical protein
MKSYAVIGVLNRKLPQNQVTSGWATTLSEPRIPALGKSDEGLSLNIELG